MLSTLALTGAVLVSAQPAGAQQYNQYGQYGQYGTKPTTPGQQILIDKLVAQPGTANGKGGEFVAVYKDNLLLSDPRYAPGDQVVFKVVVKNVSGTTLKNIVVKDTIPAYVEPMVGPGTYDAKTRTVTYTIAELKPNEENVQYMKMQIFPQNKLPANESVIKQLNNVEVRVNTLQDTDSSQFFTEKQAIGVNEVPKTGPELGLAFLAVQGLGLAIGLKLRQHNKA